MNDIQDVLRYVFINSRTGNVIAYYTLPSTLDEESLANRLRSKLEVVALNNKLLVSSIYFQLRDKDALDLHSSL